LIHRAQYRQTSCVEETAKPAKGSLNPAAPIEIAVPDDAQAIADIQRRTWLATYPNEAAGITAEDIRSLFDGPDGARMRLRVERVRARLASTSEHFAVFVARAGERVVGYTAPERTDEKRRVGAIYVLPGAQGDGVGSRLLRRNIDWHRAQDAAAPVYLHVAAYNEAAIRFYERAGFVTTGRTAADEIATLPSGAVIPEIEMVLVPGR
jgi:GNAT superfamily N-acetyltransferase